MTFLCCGIKYSKKDPLTYWCIDSYKIKPALQTAVKNVRVIRETADIVCCKKCGGVGVLVERCGMVKGRLRRLEIERLSGVSALKYIESTINTRIKIKREFPLLNVPYSKETWYYYKNLDNQSQRRRYLNESGWSDEQIFKNEVKHI